MTNTPTPEKYFDWKGNEIKSGMTIYFVQTRPGALESSRLGMLMPQTGETIWEDEKVWQERKNKEVWELGQPYDVHCTDGGNWFYATKEDEDGCTFSFPLSLQKDSIIAIKDISDKK